MGDRSFDVAKYEFSSGGLADLDENHYARNLWPIVYILSDGTKKLAYIGESTDIRTRISTHLKSARKNKLDILHLITSERFNKSAALDIESNLIRYMSADGQFDLLNGNLGLANHNYYQKAEVYWGIFTDVWNELRSHGIVKKSLDAIDNSDIFKYSPYKSLSAEQEQGLHRMLKCLADENAHRFVVEGGAGTGKTILAIFLLKLLVSPQSILNQPAADSSFNILQKLVDQFKVKCPSPKLGLVVPMSSFRSTLKKVFRNVKGLSANMVISPSETTKAKYDLLIVDESHRLRQRINLGAYFGGFDKACEALDFDKYSCSELDWVLKQSEKTILFYDKNQSIKPSDAPRSAFDRLKATNGTRIETLKSQFRVKGGNDYVRFIDRLLNVQLERGDPFYLKNYEVVLYESISDLVAEIKQRDSQYGLSRLIAGYAWPWISNKDSSAFDIVIDDVKLKWNSTSQDWINSDNSVNEVGCIHTTQGYDLNYSGIIFGREISYDPVLQKIVIHEEKYFDRNGKQSIKDPKYLKNFIINIYKTILLRGIRGTYIYVCDPNLREYIAQYIPVKKAEPVDSVKSIEVLPIEQVTPFENSIPLYGLDAAAGNFSDPQNIEETDWIALPDGCRPSEDLFACRVIGNSMNRVIPNGSICLFRRDPGGSRNGKIVLVEHADIYDLDTDSCYTVKEYHSYKVKEGDSWWHGTICLKPISTDSIYKDIVLEGEQAGEFRVVGVFERVLYSLD